MRKIINSAIFAAILTTVVFPQQVHAYLDPGTGSYVLQVAAAVLFGGIFFLKTFWSRITKFIRNLFGKKEKKNSEQNEKNK